MSTTICPNKPGARYRYLVVVDGVLDNAYDSIVDASHDYPDAVVAEVTVAYTEGANEDDEYVIDAEEYAHILANDRRKDGR